MTLDADIASLKLIPVFRSLPPPRLKLVALMGERLSFEAGTVIIEEGEKPEGVYFVLRGEVELSHARSDGKAKSFVFETGAILGDVPMLCGQAYIGEVSAKTDVSVLRLPKDLFFELLDTIPDFGIALTRDLASRLYRLANHVLHSEKVH